MRYIIYLCDRNTRILDLFGQCSCKSSSSRTRVRIEAHCQQQAALRTVGGTPVCMSKGFKCPRASWPHSHKVSKQMRKTNPNAPLCSRIHALLFTFTHPHNRNNLYLQPILDIFAAISSQNIGRQNDAPGQTRTGGLRIAERSSSPHILYETDVITT